MLGFQESALLHFLTHSLFTAGSFGNLITNYEYLLINVYNSKFKKCQYFYAWITQSNFLSNIFVNIKHFRITKIFNGFIKYIFNILNNI